MLKIFNGELMKCCMCGKEQFSHPKVETQWRGIELEGRYHYVCPDHFPVNGTPEQFRDTYLAVFKKLGIGKK